MEWVDEVKEMGKEMGDVEVYVDGKAVFIHKPMQPHILAHSAIKVTEVKENIFEVQANIVVRNEDVSKISRLGITVYSYTLDGQHNIANFSLVVSSKERLQKVLSTISEVSI